MRWLLVALLVLAPGAVAGAQARRLEGVVTDSVHHQPLRAATVIATPASAAVDSAFHAALTDGRGRFTFDGPQMGQYRLTVEHPWIDSSGVGALPVEVSVPAAGSTTAALGIPSTATLRRVFCPAALFDSTLGVMLGVVRRTDGTPVAGARVVFSWADFDVDQRSALARTKQLTTSVVSDSVGVYRACGLPVARTLLMQAQWGEDLQPSGVLEEQIAEAGVLVRDFHLSASDVRATVADTAPPLGHFVIGGTVRSVAGQPVAGAQVRLFGTARAATTNDGGEFRLTGLPDGTQGIEVLALGYYPLRTRVEVGDAAPALALRLERAAVVLDSIRIMAKRQRNPLAQSSREFDQRLASGRGVFISEESRAPQAVRDIGPVQADAGREGARCRRRREDRGDARPRDDRQRGVRAGHLHRRRARAAERSEHPAARSTARRRDPHRGERPGEVPRGAVRGAVSVDQVAGEP